MSRYDGLIIPRSYSEYINKTDAATLQQALQLPGVLSEAVAAGDNKAVKSSAVSTVFNKVYEYWNIFIAQAIIETTPTVKTSYDGRKFTDYPLLIFTIGASEINVRNTIVLPRARFSSTANTVLIRAYSGENYVELSINWRSDTEITVSKAGTGGFTPYLSILGYGSFN